MSGLRELKEAHAPIYKMAKQSKLLSKTNIGRVAKGKVSGQELSKFEEAQKMVGVDVLSPAKNTSSKLNQMASEFNLKKDDLSNLEKSSLDNIYKKISESKLNKDNLIHEARQKIDDIKAQYKTTGNKIQSQIDKIKMRRKIAAGLALLFGAGRAISVGKHFVSND